MTSIHNVYIFYTRRYVLQPLPFARIAYATLQPMPLPLQAYHPLQQVTWPCRPTWEAPPPSHAPHSVTSVTYIRMWFRV